MFTVVKAITLGIWKNAEARVLDLVSGEKGEDLCPRGFAVRKEN